MEHCVLCDQPTPVLEAVVVTGNVEEPEAAPLCRACATLSPPERKRLRDVAMIRMISEPPTET